MTRAQRGYGDRRPDDSRANDNTEMYGRFDGEWGPSDRWQAESGPGDRWQAESGPGDRRTWGGDGRAPDRRSGELRRPPTEVMPDRRSEELRRPPTEVMPDRRSEELRRSPAEAMPDRHSGELRRLPPVRVDPDLSPALEPVNPYAVVALVAALLGIFPVAIVFGLIAFTHRGGRGLAVSALVLGGLEIIALIGALVLGLHSSNSAAGSNPPYGPGRPVTISAAAVGAVATVHTVGWTVDGDAVMRVSTSPRDRGWQSPEESQTTRLRAPGEGLSSS